MPFPDAERLRSLRATPIPLHLSVDVIDDRLEAVEFGSVVDGRPPAMVIQAGPELRFLLRTPQGPIAGFVVRRFAGIDLDALGGMMFGEPRFSLPLLGLDDASVGEVVLAARAQFEVSTADVCSFQLALACAEEDDLDDAAGHWRSCLEAGDMRGHFGLGYTLYDLDRPREAYGHLRRYTELAPYNSWAWVWLGRSAEAIGEVAEARKAYRHAIVRERQGSFHTNASVRLRELERRLGGSAPR